MRNYVVNQDVGDDVVLQLRTSLSEGDIKLDPSLRLTGWVVFRDAAPAPTRLRARVTSPSHAGAQVIDLRDSPRVHERFPDAPGSDRAKFDIPLGSIWTEGLGADDQFELELLTSGDSIDLISRWVFRPV